MGWVEESTERAPNLDSGLTAGQTKDVKRALHDPTKLSADALGHGNFGGRFGLGLSSVPYAGSGCQRHAGGAVRRVVELAVEPHLVGDDEQPSRQSDDGDLASAP